MIMFSIDVQVAPEFESLVNADRLSQIMQMVLEHEGQAEDAEVTLVITDDPQIRALNRDYRDTDSATDVLSFPWDEDGDAEVGQGEWAPAFILPEGLPRYLGDVIVSYPTALAQATEQGQSVEQELALLVVHGCLHLLGYDHATEEEQRRMWARQDSILESLVSWGQVAG